MPPLAETIGNTQPGARAERMIATGLAIGTAAFFASSANALANDTSSAEVEKQALAAFGHNAITRTIDSGPVASTSNETLVPGPNGLVSAEASSAGATVSDAVQDCVDEALDEPLLMSSNMSHAGRKHLQSIGASLKFKPTSAACAPLVSRETPTASVKMQRPNNHSKFIRSKSKELTHYNQDEGEYEPMDANNGQYGSVSFGRYSGDRNLDYRCTPGKKVTKLWTKYTVRVVSPVDGSTLGQKSFTQRVKIIPDKKYLEPGKFIIINKPC